MPSAAADRGSADRYEWDPTPGRLYKRLRSLLRVSHVPATKAPSPFHSRSHRSWQSSAPRSGSSPHLFQLLDDLERFCPLTQPGVFRQIDFAHAARAQRVDHFVGTKSRAFSDRHIACCRGNSEWAYETGYILSPFDSVNYASETLR